ncbi:hypothetical protein TanjilG_14593 [Lupinus angustifolius]|uniref:C2 domain-containing protein n=1 Tax=Lupinus angustifolius TaxID=3871 RepID=A0A1J7GNN8_LUPAN|nr:PREDICTED: BON1-associated protein 2-like [Lupinus angustifolius]OIW02070.1 hypothetical protein TanjilG_14593 [Lupinus angustifolius]
MSRTLEITILSCENLRLNKRSIKKNTFVTVQFDASSEVCITRVDSDGGSYPSWNENFVMDMPLHARFITAEVKCKTITGVKNVGFARIPVSDFIGGYVPENQVHFLSYRLWDSKVNRNGVINVSVRVKVSQHTSSNSTSLPVAVKGVPVARNGSSRVVTGIPAVWLNCQ